MPVLETSHVKKLFISLHFLLVLNMAIAKLRPNACMERKLFVQTSSTFGYCLVTVRHVTLGKKRSINASF